MMLKLKGGRGDRFMKPSNVALLWLARLADLSFRSGSHDSRHPESSHHFYNQTCSCQCFCAGTEQRTLDIGLGFALGVLVSWALFGRSSRKAVEVDWVPADVAFASPRRRGGGVVQLPARTAGGRVV